MSIQCTKETITLFAAHLCQSMNPRTIQVLCGSSLLPAPLRWVQESCFQEPDAEICHLGSQYLQGPIHLRPTRLPLSLEMLGHMLGDSPPEKTRSSDAQGSSYLWVIWFREGQHIQIQYPQFTYWCGHIFYVQGTTSSKCSSVVTMSSFLRCMDISGGKNNFQTWLMQLLHTLLGSSHAYYA